MITITTLDLVRIMSAFTATAALYADPINVVMARCDISNPARGAAFLAQVAEESGGLRTIEENLNYSAVALQNKFPDHFSPADAATYGRNPKAIANRLYAGRDGNGDEASGDGWTFRGRGLIQITGRENYRLCGLALELPLVENPDLLLQPNNAAGSAGWFWNLRGLNALADAGQFRLITERINGGLNGLADRVAYWQRAKRILGVTAGVSA